MDAHIGKSCFFQVLHIPTWGVGYPPNVMTKLKRDENLAISICANKVSYAKGLKDVWDSQNWTRSSSKNKCEKEII